MELSIDLYDSQGALVSALNRTQRRNYHMISYLDAGEYYLLVDDFGKDDFDTASSYSLCVTTVESDETMANDSRAQERAVALLSDAIEIDGDRELGERRLSSYVLSHMAPPTWRRT